MSLSSYMTERLEEHVALWRKSLATLPEGTLRIERRDIGDNPSGCPPAALATPWPVHVTKALFLDQHAYVPNVLGESALVFAVIDDGIVDLAAWAPRSGKIGTRLGVGACLGQGQIGRDGLGTHGPALPVWRTPAAWLRAERVGVVVVDPKIAAHALAGLTLQAENAAHAAELSSALRVPPPTILAALEQRRAA